MKKRIVKFIVIFVIIFILMFIVRLIYGFMTQSKPYDYSYDYGGYDFYPKEELYSGKEWGLSIRNIATNEYLSQENPVPDSSELTYQTYLEQKYEKTATIVCESVCESVYETAGESGEADEFENNEQAVREVITEYNALIQYENSYGLPGERVLYLALGVLPDSFDLMLEDLKVIGNLTSIQIDITDTSSEYKELMAKKQSLEKTRASLLALKERGGNIEEYIQLENRILEIEEEIQWFSIDLGEFNTENEFCTIYYTLKEVKAKNTGLFIYQNIIQSLEWTISNFCLLIIIVFLVTLSSFIIVHLINKLKWVQEYIKGLEKKSK